IYVVAGAGDDRRHGSHRPIHRGGDSAAHLRNGPDGQVNGLIEGGDRCAQRHTEMTYSTILRVERGFTFIEIMVVVAILAILAALVVPRIMGRTDDAKRTAAKVQIRNIEGA